jgi:hypothetical protein
MLLELSALCWVFVVFIENILLMISLSLKLTSLSLKLSALSWLVSGWTNLMVAWLFCMLYNHSGDTPAASQAITTTGEDILQSWPLQTTCTDPEKQLPTEDKLGKL